MRFLAIVLFSSIFPISANAATDTSKNQSAQRPVPTADQRENMAKAHEQLAVCLRSDKPMDVCREEMMKSAGHQDMDCPMMGHQGGQMKGKSTTGR